MNNIKRNAVEVTLIECYVSAHKHIVNCLFKNSSGVKDLDNDSKIKNRIVEYAVMYYVNANFYTEYVSECKESAMHHGVMVGTVIKNQVGLGQLPIQQLARITRNIKTIADKNFNPIMLSI